MPFRETPRFRDTVAIGVIMITFAMGFALYFLVKANNKAEFDHCARTVFYERDDKNWSDLSNILSNGVTKKPPDLKAEYKAINDLAKTQSRPLADLVNERC